MANLMPDETILAIIQGLSDTFFKYRNKLFLKGGANKGTPK